MVSNHKFNGRGRSSMANNTGKLVVGMVSGGHCGGAAGGAEGRKRDPEGDPQ